MTKLTGQFATLIGSIGLSAILNFATAVLVGRVLGPAEYSDFAAAVSLMYLASTMLASTNLALMQVVTARTTRGDAGAAVAAHRALLQRAFRWGLPMMLAGMLAAPILARQLRFQTATALVVSIAATAGLFLIGTTRARLRGTSQFVPLSRTLVAEGAIKLAGTSVLIMMFPSAIAALIAQVMASLTVFAWFTHYLRGNAAGVDGTLVWAELRALFGPSLLLTASVATFQNLDMLVVKRFFPAYDAGVYGVAVAIARLMTIVASPIETLFVPTLASGNNGRRTRSLLTVTILGSLLVAPPLALFFFFPRQIVTLLYGQAFAGAGNLVFILGVNATLTVLNYLLGQMAIHDKRLGLLCLPLCGVVGEIVLFAFWHPSPFSVAIGAVAIQVGVAVMMMGTGAWLRRENRSG